MKRKPTRAKLKKKLDALFSQYIRRKDCNKRGEATCVTCGSKAHWKQMQAGHFVPRNITATRWDETNVHVQCLTGESNIKMKNGLYKNIKDVVVGDELTSFDEKSFEMRNSVIKKNTSFVPNELYEITLENGSVFWATGDHKVVSNGKWVKIKDMLHACTEHDILEL